MRHGQICRSQLPLRLNLRRIGRESHAQASRIAAEAPDCIPHITLCLSRQPIERRGDFAPRLPFQAKKADVVPQRAVFFRLAGLVWRYAVGTDADGHLEYEDCEKSCNASVHRRCPHLSLRFNFASSTAAFTSHMPRASCLRSAYLPIKSTTASALSSTSSLN